jgi:hypothetical protein
MSDTYRDIESRIQHAIIVIRGQESANISDVAHQFGVLLQHLYHCWHGKPTKTDLSGPNHHLNIKEEHALYCYLDRLDRMGLPAQRELLQGIADSILAHRYISDPDNSEKHPP